MKIGLTYDLRDDSAPPDDAPEDAFAEFDAAETIDALDAALASGGHQVERIGSARQLAGFLAAGQTVDLVYNIAEGIHGRSREALVPAILEAFDIPYTFSDPLTLALCLDKAMVKRVWCQAGLPTPAWWLIPDMAALDVAAGSLPDGPLFVKPAHEGSSKGIRHESLVETEAALREQVAVVLNMYRQPALIEPFLPGCEFTIAVWGNGDTARVLGMAEITEVKVARLSGYVEKEHWQTLYPDTFHRVAPGALRDTLGDLALRAYHVVGCRDLGRIDIRLDEQDRPQLLEINPLPGLHPTQSALPIISRWAGVSFEQLVIHVVDFATRRLA